MLMEFTSQEGIELIKSADNVDWAVIESFFPQDNPFFCGVASLKTILHADQIERNGFITCDNIFTAEVEGIRSREQVLGQCEKDSNPGFELEDFNDVVNKLFRHSELIMGEQLDSDKLANKLTDTFYRYYWIVNFFGPKVGVNAKGHYAVIGGWHSEAKKALLLDPARHQDGWFWVDVDALLASVQEPRATTGTSRGFIMIEKSHCLP